MANKMQEKKREEIREIAEISLWRLETLPLERRKDVFTAVVMKAAQNMSAPERRQWLNNLREWKEDRQRELRKKK